MSSPLSRPVPQPRVPVGLLFVTSAVLGALSMAAAPVAAQAEYDLPIREHVFDNGLRLLVLERIDDPVVGWALAAGVSTPLGPAVLQWARASDGFGDQLTVRVGRRF